MGAVHKRTEVMRLVTVPTNNAWMSKADMMRNESIKVDIVAENGLVWIKVIARNAKGFRHELAGLEWMDSDSEEEEEEEEDDSDIDEKRNGLPVQTENQVFDGLAIFKKARSYLKSAEMHHVQFRKPVVVFAFMCIRPDEDVYVQRIMERLKEMDVVVYQPSEKSLSSCYMPLINDTGCYTTESINLDVSSVLAIISQMSHRPCAPEDVSSPPLKVQAEREVYSHALPEIKQYITGKKLFMVQTAFEKLAGIIGVVGGKYENARYNYLFRYHLHLDLEFDQELWTDLPSLSIEILPDKISPRFQQLLEIPANNKSKLNNGRKIRTRFSDFHAIIFGSGEYYKMTTLTAIQWMNTALVDAGITGDFIITHEPRSLAEKKMKAYHE
ncbi:hypothetical protein K501DRAFT_227890 [Backusella circina FSU 941]|nr:hypothetical protein K501DRAFT_227890 [Backusella circina FSU 941]